MNKDKNLTFKYIDKESFSPPSIIKQIPDNKVSPIKSDSANWLIWMIKLITSVKKDKLFTRGFKNFNSLRFPLLWYPNLLEKTAYVIR